MPGEEQPVLQLQDVAAACARHTGSSVVRAERVAGSVANQDFLLSTGAGDYVLKAAPLRELAAEAWASDRVRRLGVAAPEVVAFETTSGSLAAPFLLMRRMAGRAVTEASPALIEAGRQLRLAHTVPLAGYGGLVVDETGARGEHDRWSAVLDEVVSGLAELVAAEVVPDGLAAQASDTLTRSAELRYHQSAVLLHGDLKLPHVFAADGAYVGLIDWGDASAGDPHLDLGRLSMAGDQALRAFLQGYDLPLTPELDRALTAYRLVWNLDALLYEHRAGGDWFAAYRDGAAAALERLDREAR